MKVVSIPGMKKITLKRFLGASLWLLLLLPFNLTAQTDSTAKQPAAEEESSLISPSISFIGVQKADNTIELKAALKAKIKSVSYKLPLLKLTFIQVTDTVEKELGFIITDQLGKASYTVKPDAIAADKEGSVHYKVSFAGNKQMESASEEITMKRAKLVITPVKDDSLLTVNVKLIDLATGEEKPVPETLVGVFVKRQFNPMKLGEGTTDESGEAAIEIPNNLPGDTKGNLTLLAKVDENEVYGNLEASSVQKWGIPVSDKVVSEQRSLFSSNPPIWMLVTFIILMTIVWGHYLVIIYELFRLRKEEPQLVSRK